MAEYVSSVGMWKHEQASLVLDGGTASSVGLRKLSGTASPSENLLSVSRKNQTDRSHYARD